LGGNDRFVAGSGDDGVCGGPGNDRISGGDCKEEIFGDIIDDPDIHVTCGEGFGSGRILGGAGNDRLYHGLGTPDDSKAILSDGHKDFIDCGSGEDSVWLNTSVDHDVASSCEHVHAG
jgi:Ca2+-binding RTX toxin-like protein